MADKHRNRRVVSFTLPNDLADSLVALAAREDRPVSREAERALRRHLALAAMDN